MHHIVMQLDLSDPTACINGADVGAVHLVQIRGQRGMCAVLTMSRQLAVLVPRGRLGLHDADGLHALETFRRWLKMQDIDLRKASLRCVELSDYQAMEVDHLFTPAVLAQADPAEAALFADWLGCRTLTPLAVRTL